MVKDYCLLTHIVTSSLPRSWEVAQLNPFAFAYHVTKNQTIQAGPKEGTTKAVAGIRLES